MPIYPTPPKLIALLFYYVIAWIYFIFTDVIALYFAAGNRCLSYKSLPSYMSPVEDNDLLTLVTPDYLPPAQAPLPPLTESEVSESPLPAVNKTAPSPGPSSGTKASPPGNAQAKVTICFFLSSLAVFVSFLLLF